LAKCFEHLHTEKAIVASILQKPDLLLDLDNRAHLDAFRSPVNRQLVYIALQLYEQGYTKFERELVYNASRAYPLEGFSLEQVAMYINSLFGADIYEVNFERYLDDLMDVYAKYKLQLSLTDALKHLDTYGDKLVASDFIDSFQTELMGLNSVTKYDDPVDVCAGVREHLQEKLDNPEGNLGVPSGLKILDDVMLGWLKTKFYFVAARPGRGKSAFLMQSGIYASFFAPYNRVPILYLDTEIGTKEFRDRTISHLSSVNGLKIMRGDWDLEGPENENVKMAESIMDANKGNRYLHKYIPGFKVSQVISMIKKAVHNNGVGLVIFDYIKEPRDVDDRARWQKIGDLARALKELAGQYEIPILSALQQNKKGEGLSRTDANAMGESDDVLKEADMAFMLNWKTDKEMQAETLNAGTHRFQITKGRYTKNLYSGINLRYYGYCFRFVESPIQQLFDVGDQYAIDPGITIQQSLPNLEQTPIFGNYGQRAN
jgi:replicative DNA helicase